MNAISSASVDPPAAASLAALSDALAAVVERVGRSTVAIRGRGRGAVASGVLWREGLVVTAAHVFRRTPAAVTLTLPDGGSASAALVGIDSSTDLALFRLEGSNLPSADITDAAGVRTGHLAIAVGRSQQGDLTSSFGMVNRTGGAWQTWLGGHVDRLIRLDGGLHDGLSGGPVANASGAVYGIATAALSRSYGIVVPSATVSRVVDALLAKGYVPRAFLGIGAQPVPLPGAADDVAPQQGLLITSLAPGGPAAQAGILLGDIVVDVAGQRAASLHGLRDSLAGRIGESVQVSLLRGGAPAQVSVTVGTWPTEARNC